MGNIFKKQRNVGVPALLDNLYNDFFTSSSGLFSRRDLCDYLSHGNDGCFEPRADVIENEEEFLIHMDLPGIDKKDISVKVKDSGISIVGERKETVKKESDGMILRETYTGSFKRYFSLPDNVDKEKTKVKYNKGVLSIVLPKKICGEKTLDIIEEE